jgi:hypothetical protein
MFGERFRKALPGAREGKILGVIDRQQPFIFGVAIEGAKGGDGQVDAAGTQFAGESGLAVLRSLPFLGGRPGAAKVRSLSLSR